MHKTLSQSAEIADCLARFDSARQAMLAAFRSLAVSDSFAAHTEINPTAAAMRQILELSEDTRS